MIRLHHVSSGYGDRTILKDIDLHIDRSDFLGVIGPNGSGKTTLLKTLAGLLPYKGDITIQGARLSECGNKERATLMATVPQRFEDNLDQRVESLVIMGRYPYLSFLGQYSREDKDMARRAMIETDTHRFRNRRAHALSGGELQRVIMARALAQATPILLLDEATSGLDHVRTIEIFDLLSRKNKQGITTLAVVHDLNLAALYCDRIVMLKNGRVHVDGPTEDVFTADNLMEVFDARIVVSPHPVTGDMQAFYLPDSAHDSGSVEG